MLSGTLRRCGAVTAAALLVLAAPAPAPAQTVLAASQGGRIFVDNLGTDNLTACTIGYNDTRNRRSYTAAHCTVHNGDYLPQGAVVYLADEQGRQRTEPAGLIFPALAYDAKSGANDWAVIYWFDGVDVGRNPFGGAYVPISELTTNDTICYHGYASHGATRESSCGKFVGTIENTTYFDAPGLPKHGDSGGPVFVPGRGLIGVISGANYFAGDDREEVLGFERSSALYSGPGYQAERVSAFLDEQYTIRFSTTRAPQTTVALQPTQEVVPVTTVPAPTTVEGREPALTPKPTFPSGAATPTWVPKSLLATTTPAPEPNGAQVAGIVLGVLAVLAIFVPLFAWVMGLI